MWSGCPCVTTMMSRQDWPLFLEDDRGVLVQEDAVLAVPFHRSGEHGPLDVGPESLEGRGVAAVRDPHHVLLDDRAGVELGCHVMRGRADELDPLLPGAL